MEALAETGGDNGVTLKERLQEAMEGWFQCLVCLHIVNNEKKCKCRRPDLQEKLTLIIAFRYSAKELPPAVNYWLNKIRLVGGLPPLAETPELRDSVPSGALEVTSLEKSTGNVLCLSTPAANKSQKEPTTYSNIQRRNFKRNNNCLLCVFCNKIFTRRCRLDNHLRIHIKEKPFECPHCDREFSSQNTYADHVKHQHVEHAHRCSICQKSFHKRSCLMLHQEVHSSNRRIFRCSHCPLTYKTAWGLSHHTLQKHQKD